jgi:hypothetical protein
VAKRSVTQRSFILGELRPDFLEAKDLDLRQVSVRRGLNGRIAATRIITARPGSRNMRTLGAARDLIELRPSSGLVFGLIVNDTSLQIIDSNADLIQTIGGVAWSDASTVWVETFREQTIIGCPQGLFSLLYDGTWSLSTFTFAEAAGTEIAQPYWSFRGDTQVTPSGLTGAITLTATQAVWTPDYVGQRVRYNFREIAVTGYTSPTVLAGTVVSSLPPSFNLVMQSGASFRVGDAVIAADTDYQGVVVGITGNTVTVVTTSFFDGPDVDEIVSGPSGGSKVVSKTQVAPVASPIWDEPLFSPARGYPRAGASAAGRLWLIDHPLIPDLICASSVRAISDFEAGAEDDDAIVRQVGDNSPRFLHAVNAGDLLLFSDKGCYFVTIRDGSIITPSTFNAIRFDDRSANAVRPVRVQDAVVFVQSSGEEVAAASLSGDFYSKWGVRTISTFHSHLVKSPTKLCGPALFSPEPEKYLFVVNGDGTVAALSWFADFSAENVGFLPWETTGDYVSFSPIFGGYWSIVDRDIDGTTVRFLEKMDQTILLDCAAPITQEAILTVNGADLTVNGETLTVTTLAALPFAGATVRCYSGGYDLGDFAVAGDGTIGGSENFPPNAFAGFNFEARVLMWPQEFIESERAGLLKARVVQGSVSVQSTGLFQIRANKNTRTRGGYAFGDDVSLAPPLRTEVVRFPVTGVRDHPEIEVIKPGPTQFSVLAITQEVRY